MYSLVFCARCSTYGETVMLIYSKKACVKHRWKRDNLEQVGMEKPGVDL